MLTSVNLLSPLSSVRIHEERSQLSEGATRGQVLSILWEDRVTLISLALLAGVVTYLYWR